MRKATVRIPLTSRYILSRYSDSDSTGTIYEVHRHDCHHSNLLLAFAKTETSTKVAHFEELENDVPGTLETRHDQVSHGSKYAEERDQQKLHPSVGTFASQVGALEEHSAAPSDQRDRSSPAL